MEGFLSATIAITYSTAKFRHVMRYQAPAEGLSTHGALHRVFLLDPQVFPECHGALLPRFSEYCHSVLHCRVFQDLGNLQELPPTMRMEGAREL